MSSARGCSIPIQPPRPSTGSGTHEELGAAGESLAAAAQTVGIDRWPRFLSDVAGRAVDAVSEVLDIARALLGRGLVVGNLMKDGGFAPWDEQQPDAVVNRIQQEWRELGHNPTIDDIAWFHLPR